VEEAKAYTGRTSSTYVIEGYIPENDLSRVEQDILRLTENRAVIRSWVTPSGPTRLNNPRIANLFEKLTVGFATPKSDEVDPSILWLVTYPLFFGLMFGDIGHGALVVIISTIMLIAKRRGFRFKVALLNMVLDGAPLLIMGGAAAIAIGFLYGTVFGSEEWFAALTGIHEPPWFSPWNDPIQLLKVSMYVAVFHVSSGLVLSVVNKVRHRDYMGALSGPGIWLVFYLDFGYLVLSKGFGFVTFIFQNTTTALLYLGPPVVLMLILYVRNYGVGDGAVHWIEALFASLSHTISYARILAMKMIHDGFSILFLGILNSTSLALMIGTGAAFGLLTVVVILGLETLFVFMQDLRLHWVEWFLKFYAGGGVSFKPFGVDRTYTTLGPKPGP
jgi:V/A-type H+-transporting ATPase subunit I